MVLTPYLCPLDGRYYYLLLLCYAFQQFPGLFVMSRFDRHALLSPYAIRFISVCMIILNGTNC